MLGMLTTAPKMYISCSPLNVVSHNSASSCQSTLRKQGDELFPYSDSQTVKLTEGLLYFSLGSVSNHSTLVLHILHKVKYQMVAETRNHLIAAAQNINSAHGNLRPVKVPYCTNEDLQVSGL